ncbi:sigma 54-interacting transcriptional regulator [Flammeovirga sp. SubArs3]|uniref:sigma 54-interacting transcriptional regulator n=1 Tax=Flammeovirga sp. SubArs3 TaxID=2995316 RepID=UPI00248B94BE|nr:sigma 54-interacting transcriptional regulator [Flammeovirga sp. SubArs3]
MKVLISFIAFSHDFINTEDHELKVNKKGTTYSFYQDVFESEKYDKHHLIIASPRNENRVRQNLLINTLQEDFPQHKGKIVRSELMIRDIINHSEISSEIRKFLIGLESEDVSQADLFISPGTPAMQTCWIVAHLNPNIKLNTRLIQTKKPLNEEKTSLQEVYFEMGGIPENVERKSLYIESSNSVEHKEDFLLIDDLKDVYSRARMVAESKDVTTLIYGDTGSGKENLAKSIHLFSSRRENKFGAINCSALNDELLESRLFGHKKGAFTGAIDNNKGIFEQCNGGTIFLDEIGDISPKMQQTLLRVLQEKVITPIGGNDKKIDVRVVCATHRDLSKKCEEGTFRWDLFYRLSVVELNLPSLKDISKESKKALIKHFLKTQQRYFKRKKVMKLAPETEKMMMDYHFPGNIRELENIIMGLYVFNKEGETVTPAELPQRIGNAIDKQVNSLKQDFILHQHYHKVYHLVNKNKAKAYKLIGVSQNTFEKYFNMSF